MFPTREAVLRAVAHDAIDQLTVAYTDAGLDPDRDPDRTDPDGTRADPIAPFRRMVEMLVPLGPQLMFLLRAGELRDDTDLERRIDELDEPLCRAVEHAQRGGTLDLALPAWWIVESLYAVVYIAWEQVARGRLATRDAAPLVVRTWLHGARHTGS